MKWSFFFHYNKPESKKAGETRLTFHYQKKCILVKSIDCKVPVETKNNKRQPHCVLKGKTRMVIYDYTNGSVPRIVIL